MSDLGIPREAQEWVSSWEKYVKEERYVGRAQRWLNRLCESANFLRTQVQRFEIQGRWLASWLPVDTRASLSILEDAIPRAEALLIEAQQAERRAEEQAEKERAQNEKRLEEIAQKHKRRL